jgi:ribonuclease R
MLVARLFAARVGEQVSGNIVSVKVFGLVVQMKGTGATGTVAMEALPDGPYRIEPGGHAVVSDARRYGVGDPLEVVIAGTNEELGRVDLTPVAPADGA